jgi:hypothetical protein
MTMAKLFYTLLTEWQNNPLHITLFPSAPLNAPLRTSLQFSLLLASTLDIFESRSKSNASSGGGLSGDFGLLHAIDERLAAYGFETNTGVRFVAVVDMRGRIVGEGGGTGKGGPSVGLREGEMKLVSWEFRLGLLSVRGREKADALDRYSGRCRRRM